MVQERGGQTRGGELKALKQHNLCVFPYTTPVVCTDTGCFQELLASSLLLSIHVLSKASYEEEKNGHNGQRTRETANLAASPPSSVAQHGVQGPCSHIYCRVAWSRMSVFPDGSCTSCRISMSLDVLLFNGVIPVYKLICFNHSWQAWKRPLGSSSPSRKGDAVKQKGPIQFSNSKNQTVPVTWKTQRQISSSKPFLVFHAASLVLQQHRLDPQNTCILIS